MKNVNFIIIAALLLSVLPLSADNNPSTNHSATQLKTGNRNATTGAEAVFYNPAGTVFGQDGLTLEFSVLPFAFSQSVYDSEFDKTYDSNSSSPFYPALNLAYKKDNWAVFANLGITNGGGAGNYDDGLPMFQRMGLYQMYSAIMAGTPGLPSDNIYDYAYSSNFEGSTYGMGGFVGAAYKFNDWISASVAIQYAYQTNHQEGSLLVDYPAADVNISTTDIDVDYTGSNMGFIFGLNLKPTDKLLIAQTFRYYTEMELETSINDGKDGAGLYVDGAKSLNTYVPYYSLGINYMLTDKLSLEADMNMSFYSMLDLDNDANGVDIADHYNNGLDIGLGAEYQVSTKLNWGLGFTYAPSKMKEEYMSELEYEVKQLWLNTGGTYDVTEKLALNLAFQVGLATEDVEKTFDSAFNPGATYTQKYTKDTAYSLGIGVVYHF